MEELCGNFVCQCHKLSTTHRVLKSQDGHNIYVIMKTMCPPGYHYNGFVAAHAFGHIMYRCAQVHELPQGQCGDNREGALFS